MTASRENDAESWGERSGENSSRSSVEGLTLPNQTSDSCKGIGSASHAAAVYGGLTVILIAGLAIRLALAPHGGFQGDIQTFRQWTVRLVNAPLADFYSSFRPADHLPGDLWFLWGIAHLYHWISPELNVRSATFLILLKLVPIVADAGIALILFLIAGRFGSAGSGLLAAAFIMFNPASIFLSATWGQWDSVSAFFMVVGLWLVLRGNPEWSLPFFTYAALIKPQLGVLLALAILAWWRWHVRPRRVPQAKTDERRGQATGIVLGTLTSVAAFFVVDLPFGVGLPFMSTRYSIVERMSYALNRHTAISANAFNLWGVFGKWSNLSSLTDGQLFLAGLSYQRVGEVLLGVAVVLALGLFWLRPTGDMALWAALAVVFSLFMLPTRIHERYLMPAVVLAVLVAAVAPKLRWLGLALSLTYFVNLIYVYHYFNQLGFRAGSGSPNEWIPLGVSTVNLFLLLVIFTAGFVLAFGDASVEQPTFDDSVAAQPVASVGRQLSDGVS